MALVLADRVRDTTTTTGTGTVTLSGTAPTGYQTFGAAIGNANTTYYTITLGSQWEVGIGTYTASGTTLSRDTVLASSTGSKLDLAAGTKDVFVTYPAEKSVNYDGSNNVGIGNTNPSYRLDVASADTTAALGYAFRIRGNSTAAAGAIQFTDSAVTAQWGYIAATSTSVTIDASNTSAIAFRTSNTERGRFNSSGNLLVGTTTDKNRLTVTAGANTNSPTLGSAGGIAYFTNTDVAYGLNIGNSASDGRVWLQAQRTDGSATAYNITLNEAGGNVGVGTASPVYKLDVNKGSAGNIARFTDGVAQTLVIKTLDTSGVTIQNDNSGYIAFTIGSERFRIGSAGQFGLSGANYGNSGQVLASQGSGSAPVWLSMGIRSNGQNVISSSTTLGSADKGTNILIVTSGITITFPTSGWSSGEGVAISNISGGNVTLSAPGGSDFGTTLPNNGSFFVFSDGGSYWRQYCYSTTRL